MKRYALKIVLAAIIAVGVVHLFFFHWKSGDGDGKTIAVAVVTAADNKPAAFQYTTLPADDEWEVTLDSPVEVMPDQNGIFNPNLPEQVSRSSECVNTFV